MQQWKFGLAIWLGLTWLPTLAVASTVDPAVILQRMMSAYNGIHDYTALFLKRERINGVMQPLEKIELRFQEPFKVYMAWQEPDNGRVLTYVKGKNDNKILVNPGGMLQFMRMSLNPTSVLAMRNEHHSILEIGLRNTIDLLKRQYERGVQHDDIDLHFRGNAEIDGRPAYHIEFVCSTKERDDCYAYRGEIWVDCENDLPVKLHIYDWDNQLYEHYEYRHLRLNPGLKPDAFDISGEASAKPSTQTTEIASDP